MTIPSRLSFVVALATVCPPVHAQEDELREHLRELAAEIEALSADLAALSRGLGAAPATHGVNAPAARLAWFEQHAEMVAESPHADLDWRFLGPTNISGRVTDVAVRTPRGKTYTMYAATATGGVWRTVNEGTTWEPITEDLPTASIGDLALDPSDPGTLWVGTGEANIFRSSMAGIGVYVSRDGGETWEHKGLGRTHTIARIVVHPGDGDVVYVAASGHEWTDNDERGVYRTTDGGETWENVLFVDAGTGAIDLVMDPAKPDILYAATWERKRLHWNDPRNHEATDGSSIWRTLDGGETWTEIADGLPAPQHRGRIGIDLARSNPSVLYAFIDNYEVAEAAEGTDSYGRPREGAIRGAEVYRTDDRGASWRKVSESNQYMARLSATYGWVFGQLRVDPSNEDRVYVMGLALNVSDDGGKTFRRLRGMHGDHHALWIDPDNPSYLVNGNDGGTAVSYDGGANWITSVGTLPAVQFYNVGFDMDEPFRIYGSIQDHGSMGRAVDVTRRDRIRASEWDRAPGGEASYHQVDRSDPNTMYAESFYGRVFRADLASGERAQIFPVAAEGEPPLRGQWLAPIHISPHNPRIVYHGMNRLFRSLDRGESFQPISPDLTGNDIDEIGDIPFQTIATISESPLHFGRIYVGTDDGLAHVTHDSGATWESIDDGLAADRWISRVEASRWDADTVYLAQNGKRNDDFAPYLWRSTDRGRTWRDISGGIPGGPINVVREDPKVAGMIYVGTDVGVYVSMDAGGSWDALGGNLPTTYVHDIAVHPRDDVLIAATHGRGMWALDVRGLQGGEEEAADEPAEDDGRRRRRRGEEADADSEEEEGEEEEEDGGK